MTLGCLTLKQGHWHADSKLEDRIVTSVKTLNTSSEMIVSGDIPTCHAR